MVFVGQTVRRNRNLELLAAAVRTANARYRETCRLMFMCAVDDSPLSSEIGAELRRASDEVAKAVHALLQEAQLLAEDTSIQPGAAGRLKRHRSAASAVRPERSRSN